MKYFLLALLFVGSGCVAPDTMDFEHEYPKAEQVRTYIERHDIPKDGVICYYSRSSWGVGLSCLKTDEEIIPIT